MRNADIEVTNRCNALCNFCPRDRMPALGGMSTAVFDRVLQRLVEHNQEQSTRVTFCGFGEPLIHPELPAFVARVHEAGLAVGLTTNASLLDEEYTRNLLDAGLSKIVFSISDLGDDYEEVYNLDYNRTAANIDAFLKENRRRGQPCEPWVSMVQHDINRGRLREYRRHWKARGIDNLFIVPEMNRGGALERGYLFQGTEERTEDAQAILAAQGTPILCMLPFHTISIGWEGRYLLCCQDWEKRMPLGHVAEHSVADIDRIKKQKLLAGNPVCRDCSINPLNVVREKLLEADRNGVSATEDIDRALHEMKREQQYLEPLLTNADGS